MIGTGKKSPLSLSCERINNHWLNLSSIRKKGALRKTAEKAVYNERRNTKNIKNCWDESHAL